MRVVIGCAVTIHLAADRVWVPAHRSSDGCAFQFSYDCAQLLTQPRTVPP